MDIAKTNQAWAREIVSCLIDQGAELFVLSPGSRSTPLVMAVADFGHKHIVHFDERGASYFALGWAKQSGRPSVLICTSGTALANYFPAIIEAQEERVPMVILSADRPFRLQRKGANQTIEQRNIYGPKANYSLDLGEASEDLYTCRKKLETINKSLSTLPGPVHVNCPFEEPLYPHE